MNNKTCYIINFYLGERRKVPNSFKEDPLKFLKTQIFYLEKYSHSLNKIIFNFNMREQDYPFVSQIFNLTPKYIQGTEVEINFRKNQGISYGAWSELYGKYKDFYDYFIFNEDDYFFTQNNWDKYLVEKYNSYPDCGYLCPFTREPHVWNSFKKHAGHSTGIASQENLKKIWDKYGQLPNNTQTDYISGQYTQVDFGFAFIEVGLNIYDIRDDYAVPFSWTEDDGRDIWRFWDWNPTNLIIPALLTDGSPYVWFNSWDGEFLKEYNPTTHDEAIGCYNNKTKYHELDTYIQGPAPE